MRAVTAGIEDALYRPCFHVDQEQGLVVLDRGHHATGVHPVHVVRRAVLPEIDGFQDFAIGQRNQAEGLLGPGTALTVVADDGAPAVGRNGHLVRAADDSHVAVGLHRGQVDQRHGIGRLVDDDDRSAQGRVTVAWRALAGRHRAGCHGPEQPGKKKQESQACGHGGISVRFESPASVGPVNDVTRFRPAAARAGAQARPTRSLRAPSAKTSRPSARHKEARSGTRRHALRARWARRSGLSRPDPMPFQR